MKHKIIIDGREYLKSHDFNGGWESCNTCDLNKRDFDTGCGIVECMDGFNYKIKKNQEEEKKECFFDNVMKTPTKTYNDGTKGEYICFCSVCQKEFFGHKKDCFCEECEVKDPFTKELCKMFYYKIGAQNTSLEIHPESKDSKCKECFFEPDVCLEKVLEYCKYNKIIFKKSINLSYKGFGNLGLSKVEKEGKFLENLGLMYVTPNDDMAKKFSEDRIEPTFDEKKNWINESLNRKTPITEKKPMWYLTDSKNKLTSRQLLKTKQLLDKEIKKRNIKIKNNASCIEVQEKNSKGTLFKNGYHGDFCSSGKEFCMFQGTGRCSEDSSLLSCCEKHKIVFVLSDNDIRQKGRKENEEYPTISTHLKDKTQLKIINKGTALSTERMQEILKEIKQHIETNEVKHRTLYRVQPIFMMCNMCILNDMRCSNSMYKECTGSNHIFILSDNDIRQKGRKAPETNEKEAEDIVEEKRTSKKVAVGEVRINGIRIEGITEVDVQGTIKEIRRIAEMPINFNLQCTLSKPKWWQKVLRLFGWKSKFEKLLEIDNDAMKFKSILKKKGRRKQRDER